MRIETQGLRDIRPDCRRLVLTVGLGLAVALLLTGECAQAQGTAGGRGGNASPPLAGRPVGVSAKAGRVSVQVTNRSLAEVLVEVTSLTRVALAVHDEGLATRLVSAQFSDLPVEDALRLLLRDQDVFYFYGADRPGTSVLRAVWVYAKGKGKGLLPVPPEQWASTRELEQALHDRDPATRAKALEALVERKGSGAAEAVQSALSDEQAQVRTGALYGAMMAGLSLPPATLGALALSDPSPDVRFLSLQALKNDPAARPIIEQALQDPSPQIRNAAQDILREIAGGADPVQPSGPSQRRPGQ